MTGYTFSQLIDFTRTSAATYVNSAGNIVSTPASVNLLTFTNEFANAAWTKNGATITANSTTAPDGTLTADTLVETATTTSHQVRSVGANYTSGQSYTISIYAKIASGSRFLNIYPPLSVSGNGFGSFNLSTGAAVSTAGTGSASATITSVGNGWYRCSVTFVAQTTTSPSFAAYFSLSDAISQSEDSYTGDGTEAIYLWGAQLELGSTATTYTRNFGGLFPARFDYDPVTLAPRGLLVEEQRTNLLLRSEEFDNASWSKVGTTATANTTESPDGTADADSITATGGIAQHYLNQSFSFTSGTAYTLSVFAKKGALNGVQLTFGSGAFSTLPYANFDLNAGTSFASNCTATISDFGDGWYRCTITATANGTASAALVIALARSLAEVRLDNFSSDGNGIFIWGAQLEAGSFATSYIPTTASQVTRAADVPVIQAPNFAPWYNQSEGTLLVEWGSSTTNSLAVANLSDGTTNNRITVQNDNSFQGAILVGGAAQASLDGGTIGAINKVAFAFKANDFALSLGGGAAVTDASGSMPTVDRLILGANGAGSASFLNGHIRSIRYYPTRLSNAQLQALSA